MSRDIRQRQRMGTGTKRAGLRTQGLGKASCHTAEVACGHVRQHPGNATDTTA